jgi:hypothetical protein
MTSRRTANGVQELSRRIVEYRQWLGREDLNDSQRDLRLQQLVDRLAEDKLHVAFIAEFSRGKSELINAIFLSDLKQRLLPSTAGRTTMCPTELLYDPAKPADDRSCCPSTPAAPTPPSQNTRAIRTNGTRSPMNTASAGQRGPGNAGSLPGQVRQRGRSQPLRPVYRGRPAGQPGQNVDGTVSIPAWRHAIINFPHPFLEKGLVVYDTPGLNAIGVEPELTFNLLPNAHAVLFVLAADTGVTKSDIEVWRNHIYCPGQQPGPPGGPEQDRRPVGRTQDRGPDPGRIAGPGPKSCAELLGVDPSQIYPVSAQKGLLAKINGDEGICSSAAV